MQDGIIQEVFAKHYQNLTGAYSFNEQVYYFNELQKELIEKIRQYHFDDDEYFNDTIKQILIGGTT